VLFNFHNNTGSIRCLRNDFGVSGFTSTSCTLGNDGDNNIMTVPFTTGGTSGTTFVKIDNFTMVD